jgi:FixJ family two-component response regulator
VAPSSIQTISVIVLDDDESVCRALKTQLEILGFAVRVFHNAAELLADELPSRNACLLVDVYLPGMSGIELCQRLNVEGRHLPTILMSGRDDLETKRVMRFANPIATLFKPFRQATLLRAIKRAARLSAKASDDRCL